MANPLPPLPRSLPVSAPDPRSRDIVLDYEDMHAPLDDLVLPGDASMYVMSAMETSRELIRHSYYRYEFHRYLLCYVRGPEGIIVGLAEQLR